MATYSFINAKLRARIGSFLTEEEFDLLIRAPSLSEATSQLQESTYSKIPEIYSETGDLRLVERELFADEVKLFSDLTKKLKPPVLQAVKAFFREYEILNLKNLIRLWFERAVQKRSIDHQAGYLYRGVIIESIDTMALLQALTHDSVTDAFSGTPYSAVWQKSLPEVLRRETIFPFEMALDRYYFDQVIKAIDALPSSSKIIARKIVALKIDIYNTTLLIRMAEGNIIDKEELLHYYIPRGKRVNRAFFKEFIDGGVETESLLEKVFPATVVKDIKRENNFQLEVFRLLGREGRKLMGGPPFNVGIILAYIVLKQKEIRRVMTILNGKFYNISESYLKGMA